MSDIYWLTRINALLEEAGDDPDVAALAAQCIDASAHGETALRAAHDQLAEALAHKRDSET